MSSHAVRSTPLSYTAPYLHVSLRSPNSLSTPSSLLGGWGGHQTRPDLSVVSNEGPRTPVTVLRPTEREEGVRLSVAVVPRVGLDADGRVGVGQRPLVGRVVPGGTEGPPVSLGAIALPQVLPVGRVVVVVVQVPFLLPYSPFRPLSVRQGRVCRITKRVGTDPT